MKTLLILLIRSYQRLFFVPAAVPAIFLGFSGCRSWPTCSEYTIAAIEKEGAPKGILKGLVRVVHCNPLTQNNPST